MRFLGSVHGRAKENVLNAKCNQLLTCREGPGEPQPRQISCEFEVLSCVEHSVLSWLGRGADVNAQKGIRLSGEKSLSHCYLQGFWLDLVVRTCVFVGSSQGSGWACALSSELSFCAAQWLRWGLLRSTADMPRAPAASSAHHCQMVRTPGSCAHACQL